MTRCVYLTFFGEYRGHGHPHESEPAITVPLIVLSVFAILAGFLERRRHPRGEVRRVGRAAGVVPRARAPRVRLPDGGDLARGRRARHRHRRLLLVQARGARGAQGPHRSATSSRTRATRSSRTSTTSTCSTRTSSWRRSRAAWPTAAYWVNQHVIDAVVNGAAQRRQGRREVHLREARPEGRRRCGQRCRRDHRRERWPPALPAIRSCPALRVVAVRCGGAPEPLPATRQLLIRGESFQWTGSTTGP